MQTLLLKVRQGKSNKRPVNPSVSYLNCARFSSDQFVSPGELELNDEEKDVIQGKLRKPIFDT